MARLRRLGGEMHPRGAARQRSVGLDLDSEGLSRGPRHAVHVTRRLREGHVGQKENQSLVQCYQKLKMVSLKKNETDIFEDFHWLRFIYDHLNRI